MPGTKKVRQRYAEDFKRRAVQTLLRRKLPVTSAAAQLGIEQSLLHKWKKKYGGEIAAAANVGGACPESSEIGYLKKELASVKETVKALQKVVQQSLNDKYSKSKDW